MIPPVSRGRGGEIGGIRDAQPVSDADEVRTRTRGGRDAVLVTRGGEKNDTGLRSA